MKSAKARLLTGALTALMAGLPVYASNGAGKSATLDERVRHALATIPYYNVFDDLSFRVDNGVVTLFGEVTQPVVKDDAGSSVKHLEGVTAVNNEIEVLPLSPFDNQIRRATYRAIYGYPALQRYAMGVVPAIHIIVKDGHVTLKGVVATAMDKQMAYMRANGVPNVFSVDNDLEVRS
jgi:hyperosmotically inducible protein